MQRGHGNNIYQYPAGAIELDFSSNIPYNHHSAAIVEHLRRNIADISNYPDPEATKLREMIALHHKCSADQVLVTNGSAEGLYLVAGLLARQNKLRSVVTTPSFSEYEDSCLIYGHQINYAPLATFAELDLVGVDSIWLGSPNNPDGRRTEMATIIAAAKRFTGCLFIVDIAYNNLAAGRESCGEVPDNVVIINSFTKAYAIPALRLGYILANTEIIHNLASIRPPWSVNGVAIAAGEYIMHNRHLLQVDTAELIQSSKRLQRKISELERFEVTPSQSNYFIVRIKDRTAEELQEHLLQQRILIRNCSNFRTLSPNHFRLATQGVTGDDILINALKRWY